MEKFKFMVLVAILLLAFPTLAQVSIAPMPLAVTFSKTTNIVFPHPIVSVDRGSMDVLAQKAAGVENILLVKAAKKGFPETNISVVTADGKLSSFVITYAEQPSILNLSMAGNATHGSHIFLSKENLNEAEIQRFGELAEKETANIKISDKKGDVTLALTGLYVHEEMLYFRVKVTNLSNLGYTIGQLRFYIRDQRKAKRTSAQEVELEPAYVVSENDKIPSQYQLTMVYAFPKFTIPDEKLFAVQLMEENGGRNLEVKLKGKHIMRAQVLSESAEKAEIAF